MVAHHPAGDDGGLSLPGPAVWTIWGFLPGQASLLSGFATAETLSEHLNYSHFLWHFLLSCCEKS
jgi:hypothetical protein